MSGRPRKPDFAKAVRNAMLDAAAGVFARKGYSAATMNEIAAAAGYTAPAFYKYFKGKEELFEALVERVNAEIGETLGQVAPDGAATFEGRIESLLRATCDVIDRRHEMFALLSAIQSSAGAMANPRMAKRQADEAHRSRERLAAWLAEAAGSDRIGRITVRDAAVLFSALARGLYEQWAAEKAARDPGPFADRVPLALDFFLHGVGIDRVELENEKVAVAKRKRRKRR